MRAPRRASIEECICGDKEFPAGGEQTALAYDDCCSVTPRVTKTIKAIIRVDSQNRSGFAINELTLPGEYDLLLAWI
jgi:hypothetical protein